MVDFNKIDKAIIITLCIVVVLSFTITAFILGYYWGSIEGSMNTLNYCMLTNLTGVK